MSLKLSVPHLSARSSKEVELDPLKVKKWVEELPLLNMAETSRKLSAALSVHNRIEIEDNLRLQLLELLSYSINQISLELTKQYVGLPLPLADKHKAIAEQNCQLQVEMAYGYKRVVVNMAGAAVANPKMQALAIQRAIRSLTGVLAVSYQSYSPCPQDTWMDIHALYAHAEKMDIVPIQVEDPFNNALANNSVGHTYKQALLLGFSDPYHLPPRTIDRIHHYLDRWASLADLTSATSNFNPTCQFLIDLQSDQVGISHASDRVEVSSPRYRLLNTVNLARQVHAHLTQLMNNRMPSPDGLPENFFEESGQDLLKRLITSWGVNPQRAFRRNQRSGYQKEMVVGLDAISYWINQGEEFIVSSSFVGPTPQRTLISANDVKKKTAPLPGQEYTTWDIQDEGAGGVSLSKSGQIPMPVQVGDLIMTRTPGEGNPWGIGVIRWVKSTTPSNIEIGIQHLAPRADPVVIKVLTEDKKESDFLPALLLPRVKPLKQLQSLITRRGIHKPGAQVYMDNGFKLFRIEPTAMIEASHSFEQFQFSILNT